eukprot:1176163-Prymnesium_polylepis.1
MSRRRIGDCTVVAAEPALRASATSLASAPNVVNPWRTHALKQKRRKRGGGGLAVSPRPLLLWLRSERRIMTAGRGVHETER